MDENLHSATPTHEHHPITTNDAFLEGVSNNVLLLFLVTILSFCAIYVYSKYSTRNRVIHPNHLGAVNSARDLLNLNDEQSPPPRRPRNANETCPICLDRLAFEVETNCGHIFCAACIIAYWDTGNWISQMNCPVCRQQVNVLLENFTHEERVADTFTVHEEKIKTYNRRYSGEPRPIMDYIRDTPVLLRHLLRHLFTTDGFIAMLRFRIIVYFGLMFVYILLPVDIIPESVVGLLGLLDDLVIALIFFVHITVLFRQSLAV